MIAKIFTISAFSELLEKLLCDAARRILDRNKRVVNV